MTRSPSTAACCDGSAPTRAGRVDRHTSPIHLAAMPKAMWSCLLLLAAGAHPARAQANYFVRVGAIGASKLLQDFITSPITVKQSIAPLVAFGGSLPVGTKGFRAGLEATIASGSFHSSDNDVDTD